VILATETCAWLATHGEDDQVMRLKMEPFLHSGSAGPVTVPSEPFCVGPCYLDEALGLILVQGFAAAFAARF
jgi:hypothetical protein